MRLIIFSLAFIGSLTACEVKPEKSVDPNTGLTQVEYDQMYSINQAMEDVQAAVALAGNSFINSAGPSEKARELAKMIDPRACAWSGDKAAGDVIDEDFSGSWQRTRIVDGRSCPVRLQQKYEFSQPKRTWRIVTDSFDVRSADFQKASLLKSYAVSEGYLTSEKANERGRVYGEIRYSNFQMSGIGLVLVHIVTEQRYEPGRETGTLTLNLQTRRDLRVKVEISWFSDRGIRYRINNNPVGREAVDSLFSAFKLHDLIDRSYKMRY